MKHEVQILKCFPLKVTGRQVWGVQEKSWITDGVKVVLPYEVSIDQETSFAAAADWCKMNVKDSWYSVDFSRNSQGLSGYRFSDPNMAMLFKLTWCGVA